MEKELQTSRMTDCPPEDQVNYRAKLQEAQVRIENDKNLFKKLSAQIEAAQKTNTTLKEKLAQANKFKQEFKAKYEKLLLEKEEQAHKAKVPLQNEIKALKNQNMLLKEKIEFQRVQLQKNLENIKLYTLSIEDFKNKEAQYTKNISALADEKDLLELNLHETSMISNKQRNREKVIIKASQADLYNQNKKLKFQLENLKKKMKTQEQIRAKKEDGLLKSIENQSFRMSNSTLLNSGIRYSSPKKGHQSFIDFKKLNADNFDLDQESDSDNIPSFKRSHKNIFSQIDNYYNSLDPQKTTSFLNALSGYSQEKLQLKSQVIFDFEK